MTLFNERGVKIIKLSKSTWSNGKELINYIENNCKLNTKESSMKKFAKEIVIEEALDVDL